MSFFFVNIKLRVKKHQKSESFITRVIDYKKPEPYKFLGQKFDFSRVPLGDCLADNECETKITCTQSELLAKIFKGHLFDNSFLIF